MSQWREDFSTIYKIVKMHCSICDDDIALAVNVDKDSVRQYSSTRKTIPENIDSLCELFEQKIEKLNRVNQMNLLHEIKSQTKYDALGVQNCGVAQQVSALLKICSVNEKSHIPFNGDYLEKTEPSGHTKAIVFDFDGTLTKTKSRTTWESLWEILGYNVQECRDLHAQYDRGEFTHPEWCDKTAEKFISKGLTRQDLNTVSKNMKLIKGCKKTLQELQQRNIKLYIVSGSIKEIIKNVLGSSYSFFSEIKANEFIFDVQTSILTKIIGTKYDFEGKSEYIKNIAQKLSISTSDILFVGNSNNDTWAYQSGADTLCINPVHTDYHNSTIWHKTIVECNDLTEILKHIK